MAESKSKLKNEDLEKINGGVISKSGVDDINLLYKIGDRFKKVDKNDYPHTYEIIDIYKCFNTYYYVFNDIDNNETINLIRAQIQSSYIRID